MEDIFEDLENSINYIISNRERPLLLMYYSHEKGEISKEDIEIIEQVLLEHMEEYNLDNINEIDILLQTRGGEANSAYRLIQLIRNYCNNVFALIPTYSYSGGTIMTFGCDNIEVSKQGVLGPIDVQLGISNSSSFALLNVEKYIEFVNDCSKNLFQLSDERNKTEYVKCLTSELVESVGPLALGELFRLKNMTELHAKTLLKNYLLKNDSNRKERTDIIVERFTGGAPSHNFDMDYHLLQSAFLPVSIMDKNIYKHSKNILDILKVLEFKGYICKFSGDNHRLPYFKVFTIKKNETKKE